MLGPQNDRGGGPNVRGHFEVESSACEQTDPGTGRGGRGYDESGRDAHGHGANDRGVNDRDANDRSANDRSANVRDLYRDGAHAHSPVGGLCGNGSNDRARHDCVRHANARRVSDHGGHVQKPANQQD